MINFFKTDEIINALDKMLDDAISGEFEPSRYDESKLSKIEYKLSRFLSMNKLKKGQIENEQAKIYRLISDISHQTKTPIANIVLYAQLLEEEKNISESSKALISQITNGTQKLNFLIQSLIKASRLENGIIKVSPLKSDVAELISEVLKQCNAKAQNKNISFILKPVGEQFLAMFDPKWCAEAVHNIVDNAIKYTPSGGKIEINIKPYEMFIRIDVSDNGKGISEEDLPRIFGRFWRGKHTNENEGVGIGLYLAREIIRACDGYIKISSEVGKGSVFSIFLPNAK